MKNNGLFSAEMLKKLGMDEDQVKTLSKNDIDLSVKSPYNFVSFDESMGRIEAYLEDLPKQNGLLDKTFQNGYVNVEVVTTAPLAIFGSNKEQVKNREGQPIIPGSSFRGLIRQNCQILSMSHISSDIEGDKKLTYRDLATTSVLGKDYKRILDIVPVDKASVARNVKAGYLIHDERGYVIQPASESSGKTFHLIHEGHLRDLVGNVEGVHYLYPQGKRPADFGSSAEYYQYFKNYALKGRNTTFKPYYKMNVDFTRNGYNTTALKLGGGKGALLCSGFMQTKKRHTLINPADYDQNGLVIPIDDITSYESFLRMNKVSEPYYKLPIKGQSRPCFYINKNGKIYFGFTQYLRLFFENPLKVGIPNQGESIGGYDYVDSMFGFSNSKGDGGYRSRLSFCDFVAKGAKIASEEISVIMGNPKPTFYRYYILQKDEKGTTYNQDKFRLRGFKQYWLKSEPDICPPTDKEKILTRFKPVQKGTSFSGRIYFNQLTTEEIGLLLWAIKVDPHCEYNIGYGKSYGYGSFKVSQLELHVEDELLKYEACALEGYTHVFEGMALQSYVKAYQKDIEKKTKRKVEEIPSVKEFIQMKTHKVKPEESTRFKYLELREHKNAKKLPMVEDYIGKYTETIKD